MIEFIKANAVVRNIILVSTSLSITGFIGYIDYKTGTRISMALIYLIPIAMASWFVGRWSGITISTITNVVELAANSTADSFSIDGGIEIWNFFVRLSFYALFAFLISYAGKQLEKERTMARIDHLTGINNSRSFYEYARVERERARRSGAPFTIAYIDIDDFKSVNDTLGHPEGDNLLKSAAQTMKRSLRITDMVARIGGDEFLLLLTMDDYDQAHNTLRRIMGILIDLMGKNGWTVTFSIGAVTCLSNDEAISVIIKKADDLMYEVKQTGKNNIKHIMLQ